jgi:hypothetical protein
MITPKPMTGHQSGIVRPQIVNCGRSPPSCRGVSRARGDGVAGLNVRTCGRECSGMTSSASALIEVIVHVLYKYPAFLVRIANGQWTGLAGTELSGTAVLEYPWPYCLFA